MGQQHPHHDDRTWAPAPIAPLAHVPTHSRTLHLNSCNYSDFALSTLRASFRLITRVQVLTSRLSHHRPGPRGAPGPGRRATGPSPSSTNDLAARAAFLQEHEESQRSRKLRLLDATRGEARAPLARPSAAQPFSSVNMPKSSACKRHAKTAGLPGNEQASERPRH